MVSPTCASVFERLAVFIVLCFLVEGGNFSPDT